MASKKVIGGAVSYTELFNRCPADQAKFLRAVQAKNKEYRDKLSALPEDKPVIDWKFYKANVRTEMTALVDEFEKKYKEFQVPNPEDKFSAEIDKIKNEVTKEWEGFVRESQDRIKAHEKRIEEVSALIPYEKMTMEEFMITNPELALDFINKPTFWPHLPDEQTPGPTDPHAGHEHHE